MIIKINLFEPSIGSISDHHYNYSRYGPLDILVEWNGTMFLVIFMFLRVSTSYMNELVFCTLKTFKIFVLMQIKKNYYMSSIPSYHYYPLV
jgi:hypothetical protein